MKCRSDMGAKKDKKKSAFAVTRATSAKPALKSSKEKDNVIAKKKKKEKTKRGKKKKAAETVIILDDTDKNVNQFEECIEISDDDCETNVKETEKKCFSETNNASNKVFDKQRKRAKSQQHKTVKKLKTNQTIDDEKLPSESQSVSSPKTDTSVESNETNQEEKDTLDSHVRSNSPADGNEAESVSDGVDDGEAQTVAEQYESDDNRKNLAAVKIPGGVLLFAKHPAEFILKGLVRLQMFAGSCNIMGHCLVPSDETYDIYSPTCASFLTVKTMEPVKNEKKTLKKVNSLFQKTNDNAITKINKIFSDLKLLVILKCQKLKSNICKFITKFNPYSNFFKIEGDKTDLNRCLLPLDVIIPQDEENQQKIVVSEDLQSLLDMWMESLSQQQEDPPVMLLCGGKDSGKSTTNRMFINSALSKLDSVYYLECDVGQTEFTPPGIVSLVEVTKPLFGPPFTHQQRPVIGYNFGGVTATDDPDLYVHCVYLCAQEYHKLKTSKPLIINCMGWMKGLGWQLLMDSIRITSPSHVIQLKAPLNSQNIYKITHDVLDDPTSYSDLSQMYDGPVVPPKQRRDPKILNVEIPFASSHQFKRNPQDHRNLAILSHLGNDLEPGLTLYSVIPYVVSWKKVAIRTCHIEVPRTQVMYALNASLVALCEADISQAEWYSEDGPLFMHGKGPHKWIGYGIIRGIDMVNKNYYVVTSLTEEQLSRVTLLEKSGIPVPENFLVAQKCEKIMYVDEVVSSIGLSAVRPRKHMPRKGHQL